MSEFQYLGIDVGTQSTKGVVLDAGTRTVVARAASSYGMIEGLPPGAAEQHPETWVSAVRAVIAKLLASAATRRDALRGIAISGQQHGCVVLDSQKEVIRPAKLWCDTETVLEAEELSTKLGRAVPTGFTASKLLWLKRREPKSFAAMRHLLLPHDYLNHRLTGEMVMEAGDASGTGFFDPLARDFDKSAMEAIDFELERAVPKLAPAGRPIGVVSARAAAEFGLPQGLLVATGGGDNMMSAIGSGATVPGIIVMSLGTSGTVFAYSDRPVVDPEGLIASFCDSTGAYLPLLCVMNVTGVAEEVRHSFGFDDVDGWNRITSLASKVPAMTHGVTFIPYLVGERVPNLPRATGTLLGLRPGSLNPGTVFRAALEGASLNLAWGVQRLRRLGIVVDSLRLVGGAAQNPLWQQILADSIQVPVQLLCEPESAALGAAIQADWTYRRQSTPHVRAREVSAEYVRLEQFLVQPDVQRAALYAEALAKFQRDVAQHAAT